MKMTTDRWIAVMAVERLKFLSVSPIAKYRSLDGMGRWCGTVRLTANPS